MRAWWQSIRQVPRALAISLGVVVTVILVADVAFRVWVGRDDRLRKFSEPKILALSETLSADNAQQSIKRWLQDSTMGELNSKPKEPVLEGILRVRGMSLAVIALRAEGGPAEARSLLRVGEAIEGWTVEKIESKTVSIKNGEQSRTLSLLRAKPAE